MVRNYHKFFVNIWLEESGMAIMLATILTGNFIIQPLIHGESMGKHLNEIVFLLLTFGGITALVRNKRKQRFAVSFPLAYVVVVFAESYWENSFALHITKILLAMIVFIIIIILILKIVFKDGPVTKYKIIGSILAFLMIANFFSMLYTFVFSIHPEAFNYQPNFIQNNSPHSAFMYFSYTTITTTGFGDVTPVHPMARSLVTLEQLIGLLYPVILIGRLVSMNISHHD